MPVTKSITKTRALPCRRAESRKFSPLASPAIVASATFLRFARLADAQVLCLVLFPERDRLTLWATGRFVFGYRLGGVLCGVTPSPSPAAQG